MNARASRALAAAGTALAGIVALGTLLLGYYHATHHGRVSGTIEPLAGMLLAAAIVLIWRARRAGASGPGAEKRFRTGMAIIAGIDAIVLALSGYHAWTRGEPSGILEISYVALLTLALYLFRRSWRALRPGG